MLFDFNGKTALVAGGTSGIGLAIAEALRDAGCAVTAAGVIGKEPPGASGIAFEAMDVTDAGSIDRVEVLRGANSVPWGSQAIGGVVNVTTMQPADGFQARGNVEYGSFNSVFANGGKKVAPSLIDRISDRYGKTIYKRDQRECDGCRADDWHGQPPPTLVDNRQQVLDPLTAYQMVSILEGVVQRGTGTALKAVGKPLAGKTGSTNDYKDAWFVGFSPNLVAGVYLGYD